jgi:hypothetical protein
MMTYTVRWVLIGTALVAFLAAGFLAPVARKSVERAVFSLGAAFGLLATFPAIPLLWCAAGLVALCFGGQALVQGHYNTENRG